jgi:hypothetical protein
LEKNLKLLFLDIDGVLVTCRHRRTLKKNFDSFDPVCVDYLNIILHKTNPSIIITSTWRYLYSLVELKKHFKTNGINNNFILGITPQLDTKGGAIIPRGKEIKSWLEKNTKESYKISILDDISDMEQYSPFLVQTDFETGIKEEHMKRVIEMLGEE